MRSAIARIPGVRDIEVSVPERFVRFGFDAKKTSIQTLMKAILGENERFPSRLAMRLENPEAVGAETIDKVRMAVASVPGVRAMSFPDKEGIVLVTFHLDKNTLLSSLVEAAKGAGVSLRDTPRRRKNS